MTTALWLLALQAVGASDAAHYHERRARLPGGAWPRRGEGVKA